MQDSTMDLVDYDVIILDCDGVVFDSNLLKVEAFKAALSDYDVGLVESFAEYFKNNFGTSRYRLAKVFIEKFLDREFDEELYRTILEEYGKKSLFLYKTSNYTIKLIEFLEHFKDKKLFIASGGDEEELKEVFQAKNMQHYFEEILGSPRKKSDLVREIISENNEKNCIMIGDAYSDFLATKENSIDFIFMSKYSMVSAKMLALSRAEDFRVISNLGDLIDG